jgi:hypothetical protein
MIVNERGPIWPIGGNINNKCSIPKSITKIGGKPQNYAGFASTQCKPTAKNQPDNTIIQDYFLESNFYSAISGTGG